MIPVIAVAPVVPAKTRKSIKDSPTPNTPSTIEVALVPMVAPVLSKMVPICSPPSITSGAIFWFQWSFMSFHPVSILSTILLIPSPISHAVSEKKSPVDSKKSPILSFIFSIIPDSFWIAKVSFPISSN